jgi:hypothetical protein
MGLILSSKSGYSLPREGITDEQILKNLLEVLIPSDDSAGAKEVHLYKKLLGLLSTDLQKKKIYDDGLLLVRKRIATIPLEEIDWDSITQNISQSSFFHFLRWDAMHLFYSDTSNWQAVGYDGPPLKGYTNFNTCG